MPPTGRRHGLEAERIEVFVDHLELADFRSYATCDVPLGPGVATFLGANGQGKTNLVEAVEYLSTLGSHRVATEAPLIRSGAERALVRARVQAGVDDPRQLLLEIEISPGRPTGPGSTGPRCAGRGSCSAPCGRSCSRRRTWPWSRATRAERRRFLDELITARWPRLAGVRADYDRVLRQRNTLLKSLSGRSRSGRRRDAGSHPRRLGQPSRPGRRRAARGPVDHADRLAPHVAKAYADIAPVNNDAHAEYKTRSPSPIRPAERARRPLLADHDGAAIKEIQRGLSLVGPHRDDITLALGPLPAKGYASHGESWSLALALRLGSFHLLRADGVEPVLVLDDVFAELDTTRRDRLAAGVQSGRAGAGHRGGRRRRARASCAAAGSR